MKKKLGIIGGMGPLAAADFYRSVVRHTKASCDQDHIVTYMISDPEIPKRVEYILGEGGDSPAPRLKEIAKSLEAMGAEIIVMPCVTAHFFYDDIGRELSVPFISMIDETVDLLAGKGVKSAGILATAATIKCAVLQDALERKGIASVLPDEEEAKTIKKVIFEEIKKGKAADTESLFDVMDSMQKRGAETCLIACTDLSSCLQGSDGQGKYIDMMEVLAETAVRECLK